jgi:hypothetical protein
MLDHAEQLLPIFKQTYWTIMEQDTSTGFISSDNPLNIKWLNKNSMLDGIKTASLPLSKNVALISGLNDSLQCVEEINARSRANAERFIFSASENFDI